VGQGLEDTPEHASRESALGGAEAALGWSVEELDLHFHAALSDWTEPN
jgi:hypothetical protein